MYRFLYRMLVLYLLFLIVCACAWAQEKTFTYGQWRIQVDNGIRLLTGTGKVADSAVYAFKKVSSDPVENGLRVVSKRGEQTLTATYIWDGGRLRCRWELAEGAGDADFMLLTTFAGGDLAGTVVDMDGKPVPIPREFEKAEFDHASVFRFFKDQPEKTFDLSFPVRRFANLRDFRRNGRADLQLFAFQKDRVIEAVFDLSTGVIRETKNAYPGQELIENDDLHLPVLPQSRNLVQNPGFEGGLATWGEGVTDIRIPPAGEQGTGWGWSADDAVAHTGKRSARYIVARGYNPPMLCTQPIAVKPGAAYTVSYRARTDKPGAALSLLGQSTNWGDFPVNTRVKLSGEWQQFTAQFTVTKPFIRLCFGDRWWDQTSDDQVDGARIWLDDVQLEEGNAATEFTQKPIFAWATTGARNEAVPLDAKTRAVTITVVNTGDAAATVNARVQIQDLDRKPLLSVPVTARLQSGERKSTVLDLKTLAARGLLRVVTEVEAGAFRETFYDRFTLYEPVPGAGRDRMRYAHHWEQVTVDEARYRWPFGVSGSLSFSLPVDNSTVRALNARDWMIIAGATSGRDCPVKIGETEMTEDLWRQYDRWLGERIRRYPDQIWWKTVNEPNVGGWKWSVPEVVRAVGMMRAHIKAVNPKANVLTPDPYNASRGGQAWMEEFFQAGGDKLVDAVAIHTYRGRPEAPDLDSDIRSLVELKAKYGLAKAPILFTEGEGVSPYSLPEIGISPFTGFWEWRLGLLSHDIGRSEIAAASLMARTLLACLKNSGDVHFYLSWRDDVTSGQPYATLGVTNYLLARLRDAAFVREYRNGSDTKTYLFRMSDGRPAAVIWSYDLRIDRGESPVVPARIPLPSGSGWELRDMMGNPVTPKKESGVWTFPVSGRPVYLFGEKGSESAMSAALEKAIIGMEP